MPQPDAALTVDHINLLEHHAALIAHVDSTALAVGDHTVCQVDARLLEAQDRLLVAVLKLAALKKGLAVARCYQRVLAAGDGALPQRCAGVLILLQATVAHL